MYVYMCEYASVCHELMSECECECVCVCVCVCVHVMSRYKTAITCGVPSSAASRINC